MRRAFRFAIATLLSVLGRIGKAIPPVFFRNLFDLGVALERRRSEVVFVVALERLWVGEKSGLAGGLRDARPIRFFLLR